MRTVFDGWSERLEQQGYKRDADREDTKRWFRVSGDTVLEIYTETMYTRVVARDDGPNFSFYRYISVGAARMPKTGYYVMPNPEYLSAEEVEQIICSVPQAPV